jgi:hypothetical protein
MRPSVQAGLCLMIDGQPSREGQTCRSGDYDEKTVIITHSLGGYMLMDAIDDELRREKAGAAKSAAHKILENTQFIYMMANQLALLDLSTLRHDPNAPRVRASETAGEKITNDFAKCWAEARAMAARREGRSAPVSQVVAFSDPNDILSWRLQPRNLQFPHADWGKVTVTNVFMSNNEFSIPGAISDPVNAHTGYFVNPTVIDMLICGVENGAPRPCPPSVSH